MKQVHGQSSGGACAKGTLWRRLRTAALCLGLALAGVLLIELPIPDSRADHAPSYVPASDTWIDLEPRGPRVEPGSTGSRPQPRMPPNA